MKKFITNICTLSIALQMFGQFGTVSAIAADLSPEVSSQKVDKQALIRDIYARYSMTVETAQGNVKALAEASLAVKENNISSDELIAFAVSDMSPSEAKGFMANVAELKGQKDLTAEEAAQIIAKTAAQGSNFRGCAFGQAGFMTAILAGSAAVVIGILALTDMTTSTRKERDEIELAQIELEQDINILIGEGVAETSFLVTSRRADIAYMEEQKKDLQEDEDKAQKRGQIEAAATAAAVVLVVINMGC